MAKGTPSTVATSRAIIATTRQRQVTQNMEKEEITNKTKPTVLAGRNNSVQIRANFIDYLAMHLYRRSWQYSEEAIFRRKNL